MKKTNIFCYNKLKNIQGTMLYQTKNFVLSVLLLCSSVFLALISSLNSYKFLEINGPFAVSGLQTSSLIYSGS